MYSGALQHVRRLVAIAWPGVLLSFAGCLNFDNTRRAEFDPPKTPRRIEVQGEAILAQSQCGSFTVAILTVDRLEAPVPADVTVDLAISGGVFYSDSACTSAITSLTIASGESTASFYYKNDDEATLALGATDASGSLAAFELPLNVRTPSGLSISESGTYDFGTQYLTTVTDKVFIVTNSGGYEATSVAEGTPALSAPFSFKGGSYPGTGGTCGATIASRASCLIVVRYAPTASGILSDTIRLDYFDGRDTLTATRGVTGRGATVASVTISDGTTYDYGIQTIGTVTYMTFTLSNSGDGSAFTMAQGAPALSSPFAFRGGTFPGTGGTCAATLGGNYSGDAQTCTIVVGFTPTSTAITSQTIRVAYMDGLNNQTATRGITAQGKTPASVTVSDGATYNYGSKYPNTSTDKTFTLTNSGQSSATALAVGTAPSGAFAFKGGAYPGTGGTCDVTIAPSGTCTVVVTFTPVAVTSYSNTISFTYHDGANAQSASRGLSGAGALAILTAAPASWNYGARSVSSSTDKTITVTNSAAVEATAVSGSVLTAPFSYKGGTYPGTGGSCGNTVSASGSCTVVITYAPVATGPFSDTFTLSYHDGAAGQTTSTTLTGTTPAIIGISDGATYAYGTKYVGSSTEKIFTISNTGVSNATSFAVSTAPSGAFAFKGGTYPGTGGDCGNSINAGGSCSVVVTFTPAAVTSYTGSMAFSFHDGESSQSTSRDFSGSGALAVLGASPSSHDFSVRTIGTTTEVTVTISNTGGLPATGVSGSVLSAPFAYKDGTYPGTGGDCDDEVAASGSCTVVLTYAPVATGTFSGTFTLSYSDGQQAQSTSTTLAGVTPAALDLTFNATGIATRAVGSSTDSARAMVVQSSGKMVVGGFYLNGGGVREFALVRFGTNGALDTTFGTAGIATAAVGSADAFLYGLAVDSQDRLVAVGSATDGDTGSVDFAVVRFTEDGVLDDDFGTSGVTLTTFGLPADEAYAVAVDASDGVVAVGGSSDGANFDFAVAKYTSAGELDDDFNTTGKFLMSITADDDVAYAVAIDASNGKIYAAGEAVSGGTASFGVLGLDSSGGLLGGFNSGAFSVDVSAAKDDIAYAIAVQADSKVVVAGSAKNGSDDLDVAVVRLLTDGTLDTDFGAAGLAQTAIGAGDEEAAAVAIQGDGKIVVAGYSDNGTDNDVAIVRYTADGDADTAFDTDGVRLVAIGSAGDAGRAVAFTATKIVVAGSSDNGTNLDFGILRLWK